MQHYYNNNNFNDYNDDVWDVVWDDVDCKQQVRAREEQVGGLCEEGPE